MKSKNHFLTFAKDPPLSQKHGKVRAKEVRLARETVEDRNAAAGDDGDER